MINLYIVIVIHVLIKEGEKFPSGCVLYPCISLSIRETFDKLITHKSFEFPRVDFENKFIHPIANSTR